MQITDERKKNYLEGRWKSQREYYSNKSAINKNWHLRLQLFIGFTALLVPVLISIPKVPVYLPAILSFFVAVAATVENVYHFGDNWRSYRLTLESLKKERALFDAGARPYDDPMNSFSLFVERCESIIAEETGDYFKEDSVNQPRK